MTGLLAAVAVILNGGRRLVPDKPHPYTEERQWPRSCVVCGRRRGAPQTETCRESPW